MNPIQEELDYLKESIKEFTIDQPEYGQIMMRMTQLFLGLVNKINSESEGILE